MKYYYHKFNWKWILALAAIQVLFMLMENYPEMNNYEHMITAIDDEYFTIYCMAPIFMITLVGMFGGNIYSKIRYRNKLAVAYADITAIVTVSIVFLAVSAVAALFFIPGGGWNNVWSGSLNTDTITGLIGAKIASPGYALALTVLYKLAGLIFFGWIIRCLRYCASAKIVLAALVSIYMIMIIGHSLGMGGYFGIIELNKYLVFHHALYSIFYNWWFNIIELGVIIATMLLPVAVARIRAKRRASKAFAQELSKPGKVNPLPLAAHRSWFIYRMYTTKAAIISAVILIGAEFYNYRGNVMYLGNDLSAPFVGVAIGSVQPMAISSMLLLNGVPIYVFARFLQNALDGSTIYSEIRYAKRSRWTRSIVLFGVINAAIFVCAIMLINLAFAQFYGEMHVNANVIWMAMMKFAEFCFYTFIIIGSGVWFKTTTPGVICVLASQLLCVASAITPFKFLPCEVSAISNYLLGEYSFGYAAGFIILLIYIGVILSVPLFVRLCKRSAVVKSRRVVI
jgi:hypothetical protein